MNSIRTIISLNGAVYLFMCGVGLITPLLPGKIYSLSQSVIHVGAVASAFALAYVVIQVPMGILADRFGYKRFIVAGYIFCGIAGLLYLFGTSPSQLITGRIIQGMGEAPLWALPIALLSILKAKKKRKYLAWYNGAIHLGLTSGAVFSFFGLRLFGDEIIFSLYILFCFLSAIMVVFGVEGKCVTIDSPEEFPESENSDKKTFILKPNILVILKSITVYGAGYGLFMTIIPNYITQLGTWGTAGSGILFIAFYSGVTIAQFIGGPVSDKSGRLLPMVTGLLLYSVGIMSFSHLSSPLAMFVILLLSGFGLGFYLTGSIAYLNEQAGRNLKGFLSGLFYCFWGTGYFCGPMILGYISELGFVDYGFKAVGFVAIFVIFLLFLTCRENTIACTSKRKTA